MAEARRILGQLKAEINDELLRIDSVRSKVSSAYWDAERSGDQEATKKASEALAELDIHTSELQVTDVFLLTQFVKVVPGPKEELEERISEYLAALGDARVRLEAAKQAVDEIADAYD